MTFKRLELDAESINYNTLDRYVSAKLSGLAKWWVHNHFFHDVRFLRDSYSTEKANREFVKGCNWSVAKTEILKALNAEIYSLGIKADDIQFEMNSSKVRFTLKVDEIEGGIKGALIGAAFALAGVVSKVGVIESRLTKLLNGKFADLGIILSGVTIENWY